MRIGINTLFLIPSKVGGSETYLRKTLAELGLEIKNEMSHRYRALVEMRGLMVRWRLSTEH